MSSGTTTPGHRAAGPVRTAVVGLGWAATSIWLPRLRRHPGYRVVAAVDPSPDARAALAEQWEQEREPGHGPGGEPPGLLADIDGLGPQDVDLAVVAVPNHLHSAIACRLLRNGVPVFVEKPVCLDSAQAEELAEAELAGGAVLLAGSASRYRADVRALGALAADLGRLRHVEVSWVRARGVPKAGGWFTQRRFAGGGAMVDLGWHLIDAVTPMLGSTAFRQVVGTVSDDFVNDGAARAAWREDEQSGGAAGNVEDTARGFLVTEDGVSVAIRASWASHEALDTTTIRLEGSAGTAQLRCTFGFSPNRAGGSVLTLTRDGVTTEVPVADEPIGAEYLRQIDELPGLLADPGARGRTVAEVRDTIGVIERLYASARPVPSLATTRSSQ
ncbi:Gfo/Idh/MocA family oxidoreductase [Kitasatospora sp. NPDC036755]|uniref:Gfo/Idh/MocA family protein n=1 Tax=Kitasatospora sp. NPDC036755 TaxID=3154600 RepID=UPI003407BEF5